MSKFVPKLLTLVCLFSLMLVFLATPGLTHAQDDPDTDGDGVVDSADSCPNEFGLVANGGCPDTEGVAPAVDTDADGVVDSADGCPTDPGPVANLGCPSPVNAGDAGQGGGAAAPIVGGGATVPQTDSDSDGVIDAFDNCPQVFAQFGGVGGCPNIYTGSGGAAMTDTDRDGLIDTSDSCPNEFALTASGCPIPGSGGGAAPDPGQGGGQAPVQPVPAPVFGPSECPLSLPARLTVGATGQIASIYSTLRSTPNGVPIQRVNGPATFTVLEGPTCSGGMTYFRIDYGNNVTGWALASERNSIYGANRYWLAPATSE